MRELQTQKKRLLLPDYLRGFAVLTMILIHILNEYGSYQLYDMRIFPILDFLAGPPAAPVFMTVMGFFFYIKNPTTVQAFKRGLMLILSGYLLNLTKGTIPIFLAQRVFQFPRSYFPELFNLHFLTFNVEILILAGLSFLLMAVIYSFTKKPVHIAITMIFIIFVSPFLWGAGENVPIIKHIVQPLWGQDTDFVIFPLFPWGAYAIFGMLIGALKERFKNVERKKIVLKVFFAGLILLLIGGSLLIIDFDRFFNDYGQQSWGASIAFCGFILLWGLLFFGFSKIWPEKLKTGLLIFMSKNLTVIYYIQWILIGWLFFFIPYHSLCLRKSLILFLVVTLLSCIIASAYRKIRK